LNGKVIAKLIIWPIIVCPIPYTCRQSLTVIIIINLI